MFVIILGFISLTGKNRNGLIFYLKKQFFIINDWLLGEK